jgi:hypothetical protein
MPRRFASAVFTPGVHNIAILILAVAGVLISLFIAPETEKAWKAAFVSIVVLSAFVLLFGLAAYRFYSQFSAKLRVIRQAKDARSTDSKDYIIVFENPGYIREGSIVSLVSPMSGADQEVALLRVTRAQSSENLQAKAYPDGVSLSDIGWLIPEDGSTKLYVTSMVHGDVLNRVLSSQSLDADIVTEVIVEPT